MARIRFESVSKTFPDGTAAVRDLQLEVDDGEFMILVGPSGCGKTTALRMVAGFEQPSDGSILMDDTVVNDIDPVGSVGSGSWASRGGGRFVATFWAGFPAEGKNPSGVYRVQVSGRVRGNTVSGTYRATSYPKGQKSQSFTGVFAGSKIPAA